MGYKQPTPRTFESLCGVETFRDTRGRLWYLTVQPMSRLDIFCESLNRLLARRVSRREQARFIQHNTYSRTPSPAQRLRRGLGLPDLSRRRIMKTFPAADIAALIDAACNANLDTGLKTYLKNLHGRNNYTEPPDQSAIFYSLVTTFACPPYRVAEMTLKQIHTLLDTNAREHAETARNALMHGMLGDNPEQQCHPRPI